MGRYEKSKHLPWLQFGGPRCAHGSRWAAEDGVIGRQHGGRVAREGERRQRKEAGPIGSAAACRARRRWARSRAASRAQATTGATPRTRDDSDHNETDYGFKT